MMVLAEIILGMYMERADPRLQVNDIIQSDVDAAFLVND
jgi:hypothetical protein